jgi:hypothetical protein
MDALSKTLSVLEVAGSQGAVALVQKRAYIHTEVIYAAVLCMSMRITEKHDQCSSLP